MRPVRFTVLCAPTDSSDNTRLRILLYCFACLYHSLEAVQPSWIAVPYPTTKLGIFISKSFVGIKQGVIRVTLKTLLNNKVGNQCLQNFTSASARWLCWFYIKLSLHILQQNCAHDYMWYLRYVDKLTSNKHAKTVNLRCAGNKVL